MQRTHTEKPDMLPGRARFEPYLDDHSEAWRLHNNKRISTGCARTARIPKRFVKGPVEIVGGNLHSARTIPLIRLSQPLRAKSLLLPTPLYSWVPPPEAP